MKALALFFVLFSAAAFARPQPSRPSQAPQPMGPSSSQDFIHEVGTALTATLVTVNTNPAGVILDSGLLYFYSLTREIQIGLFGTLLVQGGAVAFTAAAGPTLNFGGNDLRDDFFLGVAGGIIYAQTATTPTMFQIIGVIGKRFKILENVSYRPYVQGTFLTTGNLSFTAFPVSFSLVF